MAIRHDIFDPPDKNPDDPKIKVDKEKSEADYWKTQRETARAKREFEAEERETRRAADLEQNPPEPPFQVKGSFDLGHYDLQAQQAEYKAQIEKIQGDAQAQIKTLDKERNDYRDQVQEIRLKMVEDGLKAQIEMLHKSLLEGITKPKEPEFVDQVNHIAQVAGILGYKKMDEGEGLPSEVRLKMFEMEMNENQSQRKFEWDKMMSERNWQLELKKLENENQARMAEIQKEREKRGMMASPFESIGAALARGLIDSKGEIPKLTATTKRKKSSYHLQANEDDSGTVECPECHEQIAIAPKTRSAICPGCEMTIPIERAPATKVNEAKDARIPT